EHITRSGSAPANDTEGLPCSQRRLWHPRKWKGRHRPPAPRRLEDADDAFGDGSAVAERADYVEFGSALLFLKGASGRCPVLERALVRRRWCRRARSGDERR